MKKTIAIAGAFPTGHLVWFVTLTALTFLLLAIPAGAQENHLDVRVTKMTACYKQEIIETGLPGRAVTEAEARAYYACLNNTKAQDERDYDLPGGKIILAKNRGMGDPHDLEVPARVKYTVKTEAQLGAAVDFNWFGSRAADNPFAQMNFTIDNVGDAGGWELFLAKNTHIGGHDDLAMADYNNAVVTKVKKWGDEEDEKYEFTIGLELFHAPAQFGAPKAIFVAPLLKVKYIPSKRWDATTVVQGVTAVDTDYSGDTVFIVAEFVLHNPWSDSVTIDWTIAPVIGDTGRASLYGGPKVTKKLRSGLEVWAKAFFIETWDPVTKEFVHISPKPVIGFKWVKPVTK